MREEVEEERVRCVTPAHTLPHSSVATDAGDLSKRALECGHGRRKQARGRTWSRRGRSWLRTSWWPGGHRATRSTSGSPTSGSHTDPATVPLRLLPLQTAPEKGMPRQMRQESLGARGGKWGSRAGEEALRAGRTQVCLRGEAQRPRAALRGCEAEGSVRKGEGCVFLRDEGWCVLEAGRGAARTNRTLSAP